MLIRTINLLIVAVMMLALLGGAAAAQEKPEFPGPEKEHQWLKQFVGKWTTTSKASMGPDMPEMECSGTIESRMLGEFWVVNEMQSTVQEMSMRGLQTIGYDPAKKKYVGPNFMAAGKLTKFRDAYEFKTPDHIIVTSSMLGEDGKWITFMTGDSKRIAGKTPKKAQQ